MSEEIRSMSELKKLLVSNSKIEKVYPPVFASYAKLNIVTVLMKCPDRQTQTKRRSICIKGISKNLYIDLM
jgi:hypothetical protein